MSRFRSPQGTCRRTRSACLVGVQAAVLALASCSAQNEEMASDAPRTPVEARGVASDSLHNVIEIVPGVYSGSGPASEADFAELERLGVRSIVSVDGAAPAIDLARAHTMRYAHIPIAYGGVEPQEGDALARAIRDLPRPIYVHCHHGLHRGPAAAAVGLICTGELSNERGLEFLRLAGTSEKYGGLFEAVASARAMDPSAIDAVTLAGEVAEVGDFVRAMADIDRAFDHLKLLKEHGWRAPADHPDLVAPAEAGLIHDRLRSIRSDGSHEWRDDARFLALLDESASAASELERRLVEGGASADVAFDRLRSTCSACHAEYR